MTRILPRAAAALTLAFCTLGSAEAAVRTGTLTFTDEAGAVVGSGAFEFDDAVTTQVTVGSTEPGGTVETVTVAAPTTPRVDILGVSLTGQDVFAGLAASDYVERSRATVGGFEISAVTSGWTLADDPALETALNVLTLAFAQSEAGIIGTWTFAGLAGDARGTFALALSEAPSSVPVPGALALFLTGAAVLGARQTSGAIRLRQSCC